MNLRKLRFPFSSSAPEFQVQEQAHHNPVKTVTLGMPQLLRRAAAEGAVLLENQVLPLPADTKISLFGRCQLDHFYTGYGSGGDVNLPYAVNLLEGLRRCDALRVNEDLAFTYESWVREHPADHGDWGHWPQSHPEMPVTEDLVTTAAKSSDQAVILIGRASGEDRESLLEDGSYYLTEEERNLLQTVTARFPDAVLLLNIGSVMDLSFLDEFSFGAVMILWQGGMESGNAAADLLCGHVTPSGRLTDTVARTYADYPATEGFGDPVQTVYQEDIYVGYRWFETFGKEKVRYPFGYGLSYTTFSLQAAQTDALTFRVTVTNTGHFPGKETVMLFVSKPQGSLGNPERELVAFGKTRLLSPGETQELAFTVTRYQLSSFDDTGLTGFPNAYVLLSGDYRFFCGPDVRSAAETGVFSVTETTLLKQHEEAAAPQQDFSCLARENGQMVYRHAQLRKTDLKQRILTNLPKSLPMTGDQGWKFSDVKNGRIDLDTFLAQLSLKELKAISRGGYIMDHPLGAKGNAGILGGVTESLRQKGISPVTATDGPSGLRLYDSCSLLPIGTLLACTFDTALVEEVYTALAGEMATRGSQLLLAPGMNIHRNVLCGRNFEYYSEDPYLTGRMAAAAVKGIQSRGASACPKHFACNNQETARTQTNSVLTQRALREIYLKGFEICVKQAKPKSLMTCYNKVNGVWGHYHYDLAQTILRGEWGYAGLVVTDWWMQYAPSPEWPNLTGNAYRVRSGVDVLMPGSRGFADRSRRPDGTLLKTFGRKNGITLGELQQSARHVLQFLLELG